jgi:hypothetical protein
VCVCVCVTADKVEEVQETKLGVSEWLQQGIESSGLRLDPREHAEMELVVTLICSYFDIVRKNLRDALPKATMHLMVNQVTHLCKAVPYGLKVLQRAALRLLYYASYGQSSNSSSAVPVGRMLQHVAVP